MIDNTIRILVIEDEEFDVRRILNTVKPFEKIEISEIVSSGAEALNLLNARRDFYDVVIMDFQIAGGLMGEELIGEIKSINPLIQIIVITKMTIHQTDFDFANRLIQAGAFWFCTKYPGDIENYIYQPTDFILSIVNAYEKKELESRHQDSTLKLNKNIQNILKKKRIIGESPAIEQVKQKIQQFASTNASVLIYGKSGTGKELVATNIHYLSNRALENFVPINCGSIPRDLIESELFGFEKGSFTGAQESRLGLFERANKGTIFLDEVSEFPLPAQSKLLRVLQDGQIDKIGRKKSYEVNVRIISATNIDLQKMVQKKEFREDLFYRLNVLQIYVPSLQERREDILALMMHFLNQYAIDMSCSVPQLTENARNLLENHDWPGNVRQLQNVAQRLLFLNTESVTHSMVADAIGIKTEGSSENLAYHFDRDHIKPLKDIERHFRRAYIQFVRGLSKTDAEAAQMLDLAPPNFFRICKELKLK
ncbi:MAG: sigma-54-dependent Fis family transcriptional regulator [Candidatus Marinimicrobia bacterium]|nr:sigma-54-dependent Fis family transcriptional regulator [Candidatus Neomarinimicrobiota bacterium]